MNEYSLISAFLVGLMGSTHCLAMCGSLAGCFSFAISAPTPYQRTYYLFLLNLGRISCYLIQGAVAGYVGYFLTKQFGLKASQGLRLFAAVMMILMGLYLMGWWRVLQYLEIGGNRLWQKLTTFRTHFLPLDRPAKAYLLGLCWGGLPCGLVYSTLALALASKTAFEGAGMMLCFGLGTLPSMLLIGLTAYPAQQFIQRYRLKPLLGFSVALMGGFLLKQSLVPMGGCCH